MLPLVPTPSIRLGNLFPRRVVHAKCEFLAPSGCFKIRGAVHPTIADGLILETPHPQVQQAIADGGVAISLVPEADIRAALKELFEAQALVVEPSSAITLAFVKAHAAELEEPICVILTGENIAREDHRRLIGGPEEVRPLLRGDNPGGNNRGHHSGRFHVRLVHIGPDGLKVDPFFSIDLNKLSTGPARGHDMLLN